MLCARTFINAAEVFGNLCHVTIDVFYSMARRYSNRFWAQQIVPANNNIMMTHSVFLKMWVDKP